jgi:6,7-dimethyl-8-ribityllumazine synthase
MDTYQGTLQAKDLKIGIVLSRFNQFISERLLEGAIDALYRLGAQEDNISIFKVPGSFEIPLVAKKIAQAKRVDGIIALGAIIRGDTPHFDFLSAEVTKGLAQISMEDGIPVSNGVLTVDTIEQGIERAGSKAGNKGTDSAFALVETLNLIRESGLE